MTTLFAIPFIFLSIFSDETSIAKQFEVYHNDEHVGTLFTQKIIKSDTVHIQLYSHVKIESVVDVNVEESISNTFIQGKLTDATHHRKIHHISDKYQHFWLGEHGYETDDGKWEGQSTHISQTVLELYFEEPVNLKSIFSEHKLAMIEVLHPNHYSYKLEHPNGNTTTYIYAHGELQTVTSETQWGVIEFRKVN